MTPKLLTLVFAVLASAGWLEDEHEAAPAFLQFGSTQEEVFELLDEPRPIEEFELLDAPISPMPFDELHKPTNLEALEADEMEASEADIVLAGTRGHQDLEFFQQTHGRRRQSSHVHSAKAVRSYYHRVKSAFITMKNLSKSVRSVEATVNETYRMVVSHMDAEEVPLAGHQAAAFMEVIGGEASGRRRHRSQNTASTVEAKIDELQHMLEYDQKRLQRCDKLDQWTREKLKHPETPTFEYQRLSFLSAGKEEQRHDMTSQGDPAKHIHDRLNQIQKGMNELRNEIEGLVSDADDTRDMVLHKDTDAGSESDLGEDLGDRSELDW